MASEAVSESVANIDAAEGMTEREKMLASLPCACSASWLARRGETDAQL